MERSRKVKGLPIILLIMSINCQNERSDNHLEGGEITNDISHQHVRTSHALERIQHVVPVVYR